MNQGWLSRLASILALLPALALGGCRFAGRSASETPSSSSTATVAASAGAVNSSDAADTELARALRSPAVDDRLQLLARWQAQLVPPPDAGAVLLGDPHPQVRLAAMRLARLRPWPAAAPHVLAATHDADISVRLAALDALPQFPSPEAHTRLRELAAEPGERVRAGAVAGLARLGDRDALLAAAHDRSWLVRREAAAGLIGPPSPALDEAAQRLLDDPSMEVRLRMIDALAQWPFEAAGPWLLRAAEQPEASPREAAIGQLQARWPAAREQLPTAAVPAPAERAAALAQLRERFAVEFAVGRGAPAPVVSPAQWAAHNSPPPGVALARQFELLEALASATDPRQRADAAARLARLAEQQPLSEAALERLVELVLPQPDPQLWLDALAALGSARGGAAQRLTYAALSSPAPEIRRRACLRLTGDDNPQHAARLLELVDDRDLAVAVAALRALPSQPGVVDPARLHPLLDSPLAPVRLEAAYCLARWGSPSGGAALEQLSFAADPAVRRRAAELMGELRDPLFLPVLIELLDDRHDVRRAALGALPQVVGHDVATGDPLSGASVVEQSNAWKRWYLAGGDFAAHATDP